MDLASPIKEVCKRVFQTRLIAADAGVPLSIETRRYRTIGRIGGAVGVTDPTAIPSLARSLGPGAQILGDEPDGLVADWDSCWAGDRPVCRLDDWRSLLMRDRISSVTGAFAVAWRSPDGSICLARDAVGERSLFYAEVPGGLLIASTLLALLASGLVPHRLNFRSLARYLAYAYVPGRETMVEGIYKVLPGELIRYRGRSLRRDSWWSLPAEAALEHEPDEETLRKELRGILEKAVRHRLPEGGPVGALLSGGLDSSLVVALACRIHSGPVSTYSVSFGPGYPNELSFSSMVAEHCGTDHHIVVMSPAAVVRHLDESIALLSDPIGDPLTVPNALLFREASKQVGVVLSGEGGDPCFGGPKNAPMLLAELLGDGADSLDGDERYARERSYLRAHQKCYDDLDRMLAADVRGAIPVDCLELELAAYFEDVRWSRFVTKLQAINIAFKGAHHILPKVDSLSAPFGVVPRSPLFDRAAVKAVFAIPPQLKLRGSTEKYLLKQAVRDLLPAAIIERPKSGMLVPVEGWFRGPLLTHARERLLDGLARYYLFEREYLERLLAGRPAGLHPRRGAKIWLLVTLESWLRSVLPRPSQS